MYNKVFKIFILTCIVVLCFSGCQNNEETVPSNEQEILSVYKTEIPLKGALDSTWNLGIEQQLKIDYGLNELQIDRQNKRANFQTYKIKYNGEKEYNGDVYPYTMISNILIWKSEDYYAICKIMSNEITGTEQNPIFDDKHNKTRMWNDDVELLKVRPIDQATLYTIGAQMSFDNGNKEKVGPFTLVDSFYFICP